MNITLFNNACFLLQSDINILVDPYIPIRQLKKLKYDYALISHGHIDHACGLKHITTPVIGNKHVIKKPDDILINEKIKIKNTSITPVKAFYPTILQNNLLYDLILNGTGIKENGKLLRCGKCMGFIIEYKDETIYYSGDTLFNQTLFTEIRYQFKPTFALVSFQLYDIKPLNLVIPYKLKDKVSELLGCPVIPVHLSKNWYIKHGDLYKKLGITINY